MLGTKTKYLTLLKPCLRHYCNKYSKEKLKIKESHVTFGQPVYETHPQLIREDEVTPLIKKSEFQERRSRLVNAIASYVKERSPELQSHLIVIPSASKQYMSDKIPYFFRQNTDFLYLTGCQEPDSCLVLAVSETDFCSTLFMREKDNHSELWDGPRTGPENATRLFGVDQSLPSGELETYLQSIVKSSRSCSLWYDYLNPGQKEVHRVMCEHVHGLKQKAWESPKVFIHRQRLIKSPAEVQLMQESCDIASKAITETIKASKPGWNEHEIFAKVDYECRMGGAEFLAYPPVVAGGKRANVIHYINNNQIVDDGDMVLMDAGCEYHGYSSDITRTWPISGTFTKPQRLIYEAVLNVQKELIRSCANYPTLDALFDSMCFLLGKSLQKIGLLPKILVTQSLIKAAYEFCPHHVSHYLGMDVHDTPLITRNVKIVPGMIITVEPGIYISPKNTKVPKEFRGLGVRIEDDVLITENGPVVLSRNCPKEVSEIEALM